MENKTMESITPILIGARQAAKALGVCERTIWTLQQDEGLPFVKIGRRVLFDPQDLKTWVERKKMETKTN